MNRTVSNTPLKESARHWESFGGPKMFSGNSAGRRALFPAVLLALAGVARADEITYSIVDYPAAEIDEKSGSQDIVTGTITVSSAGEVLGTFDTSDASTVTVSYDITITATGPSQPSLEYTGSGMLNAFLGSGAVTFTSSALLLPNGYLSLSGNPDADHAGGVEWRSDTGFFQGDVDVTINGSNLNGAETEFSDSNAFTDIGPSPWTIATVVPEPGTPFLLSLGALLLGRRPRGRGRAEGQGGGRS